LVTGLGWWLGRGSGQLQDECVAHPPSGAATPAVTARAVTTPAHSPSESASAAPSHQVIEAAGLRVLLPQAFTHTEDEGLVTATGQDPDLRILMVMDPLYAVPAKHRKSVV